MRVIRPATTALALCLAGCGAHMESNGAGEEMAVAANGGAGHSTPAGPPQAAAGNPAAETPAGPCPFAIRGWEASLEPASQPGGKPYVTLNGEVRPDKDGRLPMESSQGERRPPVLVLELTSDATMEPHADWGWTFTGTIFEDYDPHFTHAAIICAGSEIARVPIRPGR